MRKKTSLFFFLFLPVIWASAQSMYEVKFYFEQTDAAKKKTKTNFSSFYILNGDGTGTMRVIIGDPSAPNKQIADCELKQGFPKDSRGNYNYNRMFYTEKDVSPIAGDTIDISLITRINFWFKKKTNDGVLEPDMMTLKDLNGKEVKGVITEIRSLGAKDLSKEFVLQYYLKQDDLYQNLFETDARGGPDELKNAKLYFLAVIDTEDSSIGNDCKKDLYNQTQYFAKIANKLGIEMIQRQLLGKELSRANVLKMLSRVNPTSIDIVVFYYSGHGYSREDERLFPYMDIRVN